MRMLALVTLAALVLVVSGCSVMEDGGDPPPTVASIDSLQTSIFLTENAPPAPYGQITFDPLDSSLEQRLGWSYTVRGSFEGTFDATGEPAEGEFTMRAEANELGEARRVVLTVEGRAISPHVTQRRLEGVRFSNDYYFVGADGVCQTGKALASPIADLSVGEIMGGIHGWTPNGQRDVMGDYAVWEYVPDAGSVRLPVARLTGTDGELDYTAELWFAPDLNAVVVYDLTIDVQQAHLLWAEAGEDTAVSGTLHLRYELDLSAIDSQPNISIPNGC